MTTKRLFLMLLVMLGSVTGAWADEVEFDYSIAYSVNGSDVEAPKRAVAGKQDLSNNFFRVVVNDASFYETNSFFALLHIVHEGYIQASSFTVNNKDAAHVNIQQILVTKYDGQSEFSYPNGQSDVTFHLSSGASKVIIKKIKIIYTSSHEHSMTEWKHDENAHWQECVGEGVCTADDTHFNQANHTYSDDVSQEAAYYTCATCGYVNEQRKHQHVAADAWSADATQHWHVCLGTIGQCDANGKLDLGNHTYSSNMYGDDASVYYTCTICGYMNTTRKTQYDALDFLTMKAVRGNVTIGMTKAGSPADYDLQYSWDRIHWTSVALTATNNNIVEMATGQTCYFRHGTETVIEGINTDGNYWTFTMTGSGMIEAGGNTMSLLDITTKKTNVAAFAFANLFKGCDKLTKAPKLPATSTGTRCYMGMFEDTGIIVAPALPAATVPKGAYQNMFKNCLNLTTAPELVATKVIYAGYQDMFNGCKKITAVTLKNNITTIEGTAFKNWLVGTAYEAEGIITAPDALVGQSEIMNNMPSNWMFKQIKDYTTAVSNATEGTTNVIQSIGEDYIMQIKSATSNATAVSLRDQALSDINTLKKYNATLDAFSIAQPTGPGMRLKVTTKDGKEYEFSTKDIESTEYYRATE